MSFDDPMVVYSGKITSISPIPNADFLESVEVVCGLAGKWRGTIRKGQFGLGDCCSVFLPDAIVPKTPEFEFMEKYSWRVRMQKFRGVPSEVLIMPISPEIGVAEPGWNLKEFYPGAEKYYKPIPIALGGDILGDFPQFISKTDEPNFQSVPHIVEWMSGRMVYSSLKIDGSSGTFYYRSGHYGVCSRNIELVENDNNVFWSLSHRYGLREKMTEQNIDMALQGEVAGPGIQGNPLGLKYPELFLFNCFFINDGYKSIYILRAMADIWQIPTVEIIDLNVPFAFGFDDGLRAYAERKYSNGKWAEGVVIRTMEERRLPTGERASIKVINLNYKEVGN